MTPDAQILAPAAAPGESTDPRRWLTLGALQRTLRFQVGVLLLSFLLMLALPARSGRRPLGSAEPAAG